VSAVADTDVKAVAAPAPATKTVRSTIRRRHQNPTPGIRASSVRRIQTAG
jgi:hypothetical protein